MKSKNRLTLFDFPATLCGMEKRKPHSTTGIRLDEDDRRLIAALQKKLRIKKMAEVFRQGLRALAEEKGVAA